MLQRSDVVTISEVPVSLNRSLFVASPRNGYRLAFSHSPMNTSVSTKQYESAILASHMCRNRMEAILPRLQRSAARLSGPGKACATLPGAQHPPDDFSKGTSANVRANSEWPEFVFCTISLGRTASWQHCYASFPRSLEDCWHDLNATSFTAKVDQVAETNFAAYSYQGKATGSKVSEAALSNYIIMLMGSLVGCLSALSSCAKASLYQ